MIRVHLIVMRAATVGDPSAASGEVKVVRCGHSAWNSMDLGQKWAVRKLVRRSYEEDPIVEQSLFASWRLQNGQLKSLFNSRPINHTILMHLAVMIFRHCHKISSKILIPLPEVSADSCALIIPLT